MKKLPFLLVSFASLLLMSACSKQPSAQAEAVVNPIMPIHYTGDVQHIWLTPGTRQAIMPSWSSTSRATTV